MFIMHLTPVKSRAGSATADNRNFKRRTEQTPTYMLIHPIGYLFTRITSYRPTRLKRIVLQINQNIFKFSNKVFFLLNKKIIVISST